MCAARGLTISDEMVENSGVLGLSHYAVRCHQIQHGLCAQHREQSVGVGVVGAGCIERRLRGGAPVVVPGNLRARVTGDERGNQPLGLTGFQWS